MRFDVECMPPWLIAVSRTWYRLVALIASQILLLLLICQYLQVGSTHRPGGRGREGIAALTDVRSVSYKTRDLPPGTMDHSMHNMASMDEGDAGMHGMMMYFHISYDSVILFKNWKTDSWQTMLGSCIGVFLMAALYEGLKVGRELLLQKYALVSNAYQTDSKQPIAIPNHDHTDDEANTPVHVRTSVGTRMCSVSHLIQTLLHVIQVVVSYFLMLIFMTYNFYLCLAVAVGAGTGYFLFAWKRSTIIDVNEHCH